jgi:hypothetical protein
VTLEEAIKHANSHSRNINLQWFVCKWNDGYIVHSSSYMRRHPDVKFVYSTGPLNKVWRVYYSEDEKTFKHIVK